MLYSSCLRILCVHSHAVLDERAGRLWDIPPMVDLGSAVWDSVISCFDGPEGQEDIEPERDIIPPHCLPLLLNPVV